MQPSGYRAFVPEPLPPTPPIKFSSDTQQLLSKADRALDRLDGSIDQFCGATMAMFLSVRRNALVGPPKSVVVGSPVIGGMLLGVPTAVEVPSIDALEA